MSARPAAGVPDLPPDELEQWSNDLVAYLTSDQIPSNFREWARGQADALDAYMASAGDLDGGAAEPDEEPAAPPPPRQRRPARAVARQQQVAAPAGTMVFELPATTAKLILGALVGLFVLGAIFGIVYLTRDNSSGGVPASAASGQPTVPPFDTARANQLATVVAGDPSNKDALQELGDMNFNSERYSDAITWYTKLAALDATNTQVLDDIATANLYLGNSDEAKTWIQKALAIDPNDVSAHYNMGYVYASASPPDFASAVKEWDLVVKLDPTSPEGQTAKTHSDGLKAAMTSTAAAGGGSASTPVPPTAVSTPPPAVTGTP